MRKIDDKICRYISADKFVKEQLWFQYPHLRSEFDYIDKATNSSQPISFTPKDHGDTQQKNLSEH